MMPIREGDPLGSISVYWSDNHAATGEELDRLKKEGSNAFDRADMAGAEKAWLAGLEKAQALREEVHISAFLSNLALIYARLGQFEKALDYNGRALAIDEKLGNDKNIAISLVGGGA